MIYPPLLSRYGISKTKLLNCVTLIDLITVAVSVCHMTAVVSQVMAHKLSARSTHRNERHGKKLRADHGERMILRVARCWCVGVFVKVVCIQMCWWWVLFTLE